MQGSKDGFQLSFTKVALISCLLWFIPLCGQLFRFWDIEGVRYYFPIMDLSKKLDWVVRLGMDRLTAIIYISLAAYFSLKSMPRDPIFKINPVIVMIAWEVIRKIDHWLAYEHLAWRGLGSVVVITYGIGYLITCKYTLNTRQLIWLLAIGVLSFVFSMLLIPFFL